MLGRMLFAAVMISAPSANIWAATIDGPAQALRIRQTTYVDGPRTPAGEIDYAAALNRHFGRGLSPELNACAALWRVLGPNELDGWNAEGHYSALGIKPLAADGAYFIEYERFLRGRKHEFRPLSPWDLARARERPWSRDELPSVAAWLDDQLEALAKVELAVRLPHFYNPVGPDLASGAPGLDGHARLGDALLVRCMLRAGERRLDEAQADLSTCRKLARLIARGPSVEWYQAAAIIESDAIDAESHLLGELTGGPEPAERRLAELRTIPPFPTPIDRFDLFERFVVLDLLQRLARRDESSRTLYDRLVGESSSERRHAEFAGHDYEAALRDANETIDRFVALSRTTNPTERRRRLIEFLERLNAEIEGGAKVEAAIGRRLANTCLGDAPLVDMLHNRVAQGHGQLCLGYRLSAYRAREGEYPRALAESAAPADESTDLFAGGPLIYRLEADGLLVYGVGENGVDDGGRNYRDDGVRDADDIRIRLPGAAAGR